MLLAVNHQVSVESTGNHLYDLSNFLGYGKRRAKPTGCLVKVVTVLSLLSQATFSNQLADECMGSQFLLPHFTACACCIVC